MAENTRVRFAPSPTGPLHVGGLRTALFNYLFAKQAGGSFILRVEDTDKKRKVEGAEEYVISALKWCGISADESVVEGGGVGPYRQSERSVLYENHVKILIDKGLAYYAF
ncbi:MAG: glutamate--tRNA ligase, partial [Acidimicrobiaceae bacterium]|nr:glutamate--tRNA ligase [Acidimicrobiaceae bacterium]